MYEAVKKCLCMPKVVELLIGIGLLVAAWLFYLILFSFFRRLFKKKEAGRAIVEKARLPAFFLLVEIALVISFRIFEWQVVFGQVLAILIIATTGWLVMRIVHSLFLQSQERLHKEAQEDHRRRGALTQVILLYRLSMFAIILVTLGAILLSFPHAKRIGVGVLGSAGIVGIALGIAARPILLNVMAGFQIALSKMIKIGDAVILEGDFARIETIHLTHVVARTWDLRRIITPISYFIDTPFQNWDTQDPELLGSVYLYCDYTTPVDVVRERVYELLKGNSLWNGNAWAVHVTEFKESCMELRLIMTANDAGSAFHLRAAIREELIDFLQQDYPGSLPRVRRIG